MSAYLCPHCDARNRFEAGDSPDGVVRCGACGKPFLLPGFSERSGGGDPIDTAVVDTRALEAESDSATAVVDMRKQERPIAGSAVPTLLVHDRAPARADELPTVAFNLEASRADAPPQPAEEFRTARTQPTTAPAAVTNRLPPASPEPMAQTQPAVHTGPAPRRGWILAAGTLAVGLLVGLLIPRGADERAPKADDTTQARLVEHAASVASAVALAMEAGRPDLARRLVEGPRVDVLRPDGTRAFSAGDGTTLRHVLSTVCKQDPKGVATRWLREDPRIVSLADSPCDGLEQLPPARPRPASVTPERLGAGNTWQEETAAGIVTWASAAIPRAEGCASCHSGSADPLGYAVVQTPPRPAAGP